MLVFTEPMKHKVEFASHPANLWMVRNIVRQFAGDAQLTENDTELIVLGIDEACTNIIRHAYNLEETHMIGLSCERLENAICFRLRDYGMQFEPHKIPTRSLDVVQPGGLGLHLIRTAFDTVDYILQKVGTELVLTKNFPDCNGRENAGSAGNNHHGNGSHKYERHSRQS